jgi:iron-sulfur cluster repair protein YtfE (RIC family)
MRDPERTDPEKQVQGDAIDELVAFHGVIRTNLGTLCAFAESDEAPAPNEVQAIAAFFTTDIALHDLDEEASLLPRLRHVEHPERLDRMINACTHAHERLESALDEVTPYLTAVAAGNKLFDREKIRRAYDVLAKVLEPHMRMEELEIMPMARLLLTTAQIHEIGHEMHGRRRSREANTPRAIEI